MPLLTIDEALKQIQATVSTGPSEQISLDDAAGRVLSQPAVADRDSPPFSKSMMDGFAVGNVDFRPGDRFPVLGEIAAGATSIPAIAADQAIQIMTGAPVPDGAAAVIPVEQATQIDDATVTFSIVPKPSANILPQGEIARVGDSIVPAGWTLGPGQIATLAEFGIRNVPVRRRPRIAILATGDELVPYGEIAGPSQIRNSNGPMLASLMTRWGATAVPLGIARDNVDDLDRAIAKGLKADILLLSGGVSAGNYDLVPERLAAAGVTEVFHKVAIKPGKPIWFGCRDDKLVFGLPGNPVSSLVCALLFVQTAVRKLLGQTPATPATMPARLSKSHVQKGDRTTYWPAKLTFSDDGPQIEPLPWKGSADLVRVAAANSWTIFPPGNREFGIGESVEVLLDFA